MSVLDQLATALNRKDEEPNQQLAIKICAMSNPDEAQEDIQELVDNLKNRNKAIRSDCIKVLYEIGAIKTDLIENYVDEFVAQLTSKDNRLVWGSMTALGCIASLKPNEIWHHLDTIMEATQNGSVITQDWGIRVLSTVAAVDPDYANRIFPFLIAFLQDCRPKDVPRHAESIVIAAKSPTHKTQLQTALEAHLSQLKPSQRKRVNKVMQAIID